RSARGPRTSRARRAEPAAQPRHDATDTTAATHFAASNDTLLTTRGRVPRESAVNGSAVAGLADEERNALDRVDDHVVADCRALNATRSPRLRAETDSAVRLQAETTVTGRPTIASAPTACGIRRVIQYQNPFSASSNTIAAATSTKPQDTGTTRRATSRKP